MGNNNSHSCTPLIKAETCVFQWVSSSLEAVKMPSVHRSIDDNVCQLIPVLYNLSPMFVDADSFHTIELALLVSDGTNCVHILVFCSFTLCVFLWFYTCS